MDRETQESREPSRLAESWREVGQQLQELIGKLAAAIRAAWAEERQPEHEETVRNLRDDLRAAADRLDRVLKRVSTETESERSRAFETTRGASERSLGEARGIAISGLRSINRQLEMLAERLEREDGERRGANQAGPEPDGREESAQS